MRLSVALLRNPEAEQRAKEKAEAPTVMTKEEAERKARKEEAAKAKEADNPAAKEAAKKPSSSTSTSPWKRKFRPLPEAKAVDLFADVIGDGFILLVASALILYEYHRSSQKPDANKEKINELNQQIADLKQKEEELLEMERKRESRILAMEQALRNFKDPKTKQPLLSTPNPAAA